MTKFISPAKINLGLKVPFRYQNGYHHIISLFTAISIHDEIVFEKTKDNDLTLTWQSNLPAEQRAHFSSAFENKQENVMYKAFVQLKNTIGREHLQIEGDWGLKAHVTKNIPSPSGLGGGSSNAAALFHWLQPHLKKTYAEEALQQLALKTGADIPFFLKAKPALVSGVGQIEQFVNLPRLTGIIGVPHFGLSTSEMYKSLALEPKHALVLESKSTVQTDKSTFSILETGFRASKDLLDVLWAEAQGNPLTANIDGGLLVEKDRAYFIENDFLAAAENCFSEKAAIIGQAQGTLVKSLANCLDAEDLRKRIFTSLSGSGSAFYAFVSHTEADSRLSATTHQCVLSMKRILPKVSWYFFESLT